MNANDFIWTKAVWVAGYIAGKNSVLKALGNNKFCKELMDEYFSEAEAAFENMRAEKLEELKNQVGVGCGVTQ